MANRLPRPIAVVLTIFLVWAPSADAGRGTRKPAPLPKGWTRITPPQRALGPSYRGPTLPPSPFLSLPPSPQAQASPVERRAGLQDLKQAAQQAADTRSGDVGRVYTGSRPDSAGGLSEPATASPSPSVPAAADGAVQTAPAAGISGRLTRVHSREDLVRLTSGKNLDQQTHRDLYRAIAQAQSLDLVSYHVGGSEFFAIDLHRISGRLDLLKGILQAHEQDFLKSILTHHKDVQMIVREDGKTPDLIVDGRIVELKSIIGKAEPQEMIARADAKAAAFISRHGLAPGSGDAALYFPSKDHRANVERVEKILNGWPGPALTLENIWIYSPHGRSRFVRQVGGRYAALHHSTEPSAPQYGKEFGGLALWKEIKDLGVRFTVTIYGSARLPSPEQAAKRYQAAVWRYEKAVEKKSGVEQAKAELGAALVDLERSRFVAQTERMAQLIVERSRTEGLGEAAIITGGGDGNMKAANMGAFKAGGVSVGLNIILPFEQKANNYLTFGSHYPDFPPRKSDLRHSDILLVTYGGFGTMEEALEAAHLMAEGKLRPKPIIFLGSKERWLRMSRLGELRARGLVSESAFQNIHFVETEQEAWAIIAKFIRNGGARSLDTVPFDYQEPHWKPEMTERQIEAVAALGEAPLIDGVEREEFNSVRDRVARFAVPYRPVTGKKNPYRSPVRALKVWQDFKKDKPSGYIKRIEPMIEALLFPRVRVTPPEQSVLKAAIRGEGAEFSISVYGAESIKPVQRSGAKPSPYALLRDAIAYCVGQLGGPKVAVVTTGGGGLAQAAAQGAKSAGGVSVGLKMIRSGKSARMKFASPGMEFHYHRFIDQKRDLRSSDALVFPGPPDLGTLEAFYEALTLLQTGKADQTDAKGNIVKKAPPIILFGDWSAFFDIEEFIKMGVVGDKDRALIEHAPTKEALLELLKKRRPD